MNLGAMKTQRHPMPSSSNDYGDAERYDVRTKVTRCHLRNPKGKHLEHEAEECPLITYIRSDGTTIPQVAFPVTGLISTTMTPSRKFRAAAHSHDSKRL